MTPTCGCKVGYGAVTDFILHCPLHAAAPAMYEALAKNRDMQLSLVNFIGFQMPDFVADAIRATTSALAEARGETDG